MANSTAKTQVEGTSMNELVKEGKALGRIWATVNSLKATTKANGFDTRLGKLLSVLKAQSSSDNGQIPTHVLRTHGIDKIDRRRRSEALWFYENQADCLEFIKNSKKGFSSLTALQAAMRKAANAAKANVPTEQPSNVGQSDDKQAKLVEQSKQTMSVGPITRTKMVATILKQCEINGLNVEDIINDLQSQLAKAS
jgi:hypothetical protein